MIVYHILTNKELTVKFEFIPKSNWNLICKCWDDDPSKRLTFKQIIEIFDNDSRFITSTSITKANFDKYKCHIFNKNFNNKVILKNFLRSFDMIKDLDSKIEIEGGSQKASKSNLFEFDGTRIDMNLFTKQQKIGEVGFGIVYKIKKKNSNDNEFVVKISKKEITKRLFDSDQEKI